MHFVNEEILQAPTYSEAISEKIGDSQLILSAAKGPFLNSAEYVVNLQKSLVKRYKKKIRVETFDLTVVSISLIRKLIRMIPRFDSIQLVYDGTTPFSKSIFPAAVISRFFGKDTVLLYYPDRTNDNIPRLHRKVMSLCHNVYVGTRYLQRELAEQKITSEVLLPPLNIDSIPVRTIDKVQPHILLVHNNSGDSGAICAMRAFTMVKQKYPRTALTVITIESNCQTMGVMRQSQNMEGLKYMSSDEAPDFRTAISQTDIFVNCSPSETAPLALLAAMSSGLPSISFETYGAREIIEHGVNGLLVRHHDHNQLANEIIRLIEEPLLAGKISKASPKIREKFSIEHFARLLK